MLKSNGFASGEIIKGEWLSLIISMCTWHGMQHHYVYAYILVHTCIVRHQLM